MNFKFFVQNQNIKTTESIGFWILGLIETRRLIIKKIVGEGNSNFFFLWILHQKLNAAAMCTSAQHVIIS